MILSNIDLQLCSGYKKVLTEYRKSNQVSFSIVPMDIKNVVFKSEVEVV